MSQKLILVSIVLSRSHFRGLARVLPGSDVCIPCMLSMPGMYVSGVPKWGVLGMARQGHGISMVFEKNNKFIVDGRAQASTIVQHAHKLRGFVHDVVTKTRVQCIRGPIAALDHRTRN